MPPPPAACQSILEKDTGTQIAPDEQLAQYVAAAAISVWMRVWNLSRMEKHYRNACPSTAHLTQVLLIFHLHLFTRAISNSLSGMLFDSK